MNKRRFNRGLAVFFCLVAAALLWQRPGLEPRPRAVVEFLPPAEPANKSEGLLIPERAALPVDHRILAEPKPEVALGRLRLLSEGDLQRDLTLEVLRRVAETNSPEAARLAAELPGSLARPAVAAIVSLWGSKDAAAAAEWVKTLPDAVVRQESIASLGGAWAAAEPLGAAEYALSSMTGETQGRMLNLAGAEWAGKDLGAAAAWADQLPLGEARDQFLSGMSGTLAEVAPAEAARLVVSMNPGPAQDDAALTVVIEWARLDPEAATAWVKTFPPGTLRERALRETVLVSAEQDPGAAQRILVEWPRGPELDQAVHHFLTQIQGWDPAAGAAALKAITDPALIKEDTERLAQHWLMENPVKARAWLAGQPLSEETKQRLLAGPPAF